MKKTLSLILALLMSVSCASFAFAGEVEDEVLLDDAAIAEVAEEEAVEVEEPTIYQEAIDFLNAYGIYKGYGDSKMGANDDIQRYQMALFTSRIATGWVDDAAWNTGIWNASYTEFTDVNEAPAANYLGAISYANQNGIIEGYGDGTFGPTDGITYQNALTMVVRALGYQNLSWPWGYIEKAVNLGLTKGIVDVAYTDVLTRGEVAQVIYNALFAETKDGTTLGAKNFDIEFGWETIIITASDGAFYTADGEAAKTGVIAFKVVDEKTGELSSGTYYAKSSDKAFAEFTGHKDELAVGKAFRVCYGKDGFLAAKSLYTETLWNYGPDTKEVKAYFDGKSAVSKYTATTYVDKAGKIAYDKEVIIAEATYGATKTTAEVDHNLYAIDWANGNILKAQMKDGKYVVNADKEIVYDVAWYYNELLDQYYQVKTNADGKAKFDNKDIEIVGINYLDDGDIAKILDEIAKNVTKKEENVRAYNVLTAIPGYSAYASLELFDLDGHDYGVYTSYRLGKLTTSKEDNHDAKRTYIAVSNLANKIADATYKLINDKDSASYDLPKTIIHGECQKCEDAHNDVWWTEEYAPKTDDEGAIVSGVYVLYNYNKVTKELRVLETLEAKTGVLRAYNLDKRTINIDGETLYFDYDELEGNMFANKDNMNNSYKTKAITASYLKNLFNQFVEYVVVDGKIVFVEAKGATTNNWLVVESYAGVSNDGYIVVNAYSTADLKLKQYRIGSYNGWEKGDYFYCLDDKTAADSFTKGVIYDVSSYDKANDVYYVELIGEVDNDVYTVYNTEVSKYSDLKIDEDGYITVKAWDKTKKAYVAKDDVKVSADDKWVIIGKTQNNSAYVPMAVYTGKATKGWKIEGEFEALKFGDHLFIVVNATFANVTGFAADEYAASYVVFLGDNKNAHLTATYDKYGNEDAEWYLLGASTYDVRVLDLMDGAEKTVTAQNMKLRNGYIYITLDGKIMDDQKFASVYAAFDAMVAAYTDRDAKTATADYLFSSGKDSNIVTFEETWINGDGFVKKNTGSFAEYLYNTGVLEDSKYHKGNEISGKVIDLEIDEDDNRVVNYKDVTDKDDKFWKNADTTTYNCFWIYDVDAKSVVIYVWVATTTTKTEGKTAITKDDLFVGHDSFIEATLDYDVTTVEYADDKSAAHTITLNDLTFDFIGKCKDDEHAKVLFDGRYFEVKNHFGTYAEPEITAYKIGSKTEPQIVDKHYVAWFNWYTWKWEGKWVDDIADVTIPTQENEYADGSVYHHGSIIVETYDQHADEDEVCNLVKTIKIGLADKDGKKIALTDGESIYVNIKYMNFNFNLLISVDAEGAVTVEYKNVDAPNEYKNSAELAGTKYTTIGK